MKAKLLGAALLAAALAACGGKASFVLGGTINGLSNSGLVLLNGGEELKVNAGATSFSFPNGISYGTEYNLSFKSQPEHMTCAFLGNTNVGSAGHTTTINVVISCTQNSWTLSGTVEGLNADNLVLVNGSSSGSISIAKGATSFIVPGKIPVGTAYGLSVLTQPTGQACSIENGSGVMGDADRSNVKVVCQ